MKTLSNGKLTARFRILLWAVGIAIAVSSYFLLSGLVMLTGVVIGMLVLATGKYAERANLLHLKPFDNSYKKARESYKIADDKQDDSK